MSGNLGTPGITSGDFKDSGRRDGVLVSDGAPVTKEGVDSDIGIWEDGGTGSGGIGVGKVGSGASFP